MPAPCIFNGEISIKSRQQQIEEHKGILLNPINKSREQQLWVECEEISPWRCSDERFRAGFCFNG